MQDIRQKLLATFQVEYRDHVDHIRSLLAMIANTSGQPAEAQLEEVFRRAHTLKGAARVVELDAVERIAHRLETLFSQVRQGSLTLSKDVAELVQRALDAVEDSVAGMGEGAANASFNQVLTAIEQMLGIESEEHQASVPQTAAPMPEFQPLKTVRINTRNFDGLLRSAVELLTESHRHGQVTAQLKAIAQRLAGVEAELEGALQDVARAADQRLVVSGRLNRLQCESRSISKQVSEVCRLQQQGSRRMMRLGQQLEQDVLQARLVPAEGLIEGYRKMMRDLARDESKQIEFQATGTGEHVDRQVLEALKDPLMHVLRNAVSHGIEFPKERIAKGKPARGSVTLRIEGDAQRLRITVEDDGRGIDLAKITEVAVGRKILSQAEAALSSQQEMTRMLFKPGFSTSSSITNLSGRGMGLSVVYEAVRHLQGEIELQPRSTGGMTLQISVPVSILTQKLLLVGCGDQSFAIPLHWIERVKRVRPADIRTVEGRAAITLNGSAVPLFTIRQLLNLQNARARDRDVTLLPVVIVRFKGELTAIAVDSLIRQSEAVIQDLGPGTPQDGKISGGVLLEDGSIALVLNPATMLGSSARRNVLEFPSASEAAPKRAPSILVVDDSITTRTLEKSILEAHGYRVRIAVDGLEALAELRTEKVDLVISDVQMPRMDGFQLLEAIKSDQNLKQIPVIVVTSLERREDQERGLSLGADAYIVKRKFDQGDLLAAIRQII